MTNVSNLQEIAQPYSDAPKSPKTNAKSADTNPAQNACRIEARPVAQSWPRDMRRLAQELHQSLLRAPREASKYRTDLLSFKPARPAAIGRQPGSSLQEPIVLAIGPHTVSKRRSQRD
jgi:hypothetical protein